MNRSMCITLAAGIALAFLPAGAVRAAQEDISPALAAKVPADFTQFSLAGHDAQARLLTHYLWHHFHHRLGNGTTLFNKEYLLTADIWLANARPRGVTQTIQDVHRRHLLAVQLDSEGYVLTHQHFSHAHDHGWPFPLWPQSDAGPAHVRGKTAGWHFQATAEAVPGWVGQHFLRHWKQDMYVGQTAADSWQLVNARSHGIVDNRWRIEATGRSPTLITPEGVHIEAFQAPFLQLRWKRTDTQQGHALPWLEWQRDTDEDFAPDRRVVFRRERTPLSGAFDHSIITMHRHPKWQGRIRRIRLCLAPGESAGTFDIDSFFTVYDTRHTINNPIFILASARYFAWTQDLDFLHRQINRMRLALRHQQTAMGGLEHRHIRNTWPGHDGLPGFVTDDKGRKTILGGRGIGNNYWDLMPFGWDDLYATNQYYAATIALAELEEAIDKHPGWDMPLGALRFDPAFLRRHAADVQRTANALFWNDRTGRFIASIDQHGRRYDYGYTFLNLDAIWYGLADESRSRAILDWIAGDRIVEGDTSTGPDIYHWRFGPRASTLRNTEWYGQGWHAPESIAWGGQIQDGGAVLGFAFYDLWARLKVRGPDDAWNRLDALLAWEKEVHAGGGYRTYYGDGKRGTTLQGGGTAGGLGIDFEFYESSLIPSIVVYGFMGMHARPDDVLQIHPALPRACPRIQAAPILYKHTRINVTVADTSVTVHVLEDPPDAIRIETPWGARELHTQGAFTFRE